MKLEQMTFEDIYLIYYCDFLTIGRMAEYYQVDERLLSHWIDCGRIANHSKVEEWEEVQEKINKLYLNLI